VGYVAASLSGACSATSFTGLILYGCVGGDNCVMLVFAVTEMSFRLDAHHAQALGALTC